MAIYSGPGMVTDGLVLCLDGGDTLSYPGTGTTWTDLSGVVGDATISNSPVFSNGSFSFDGVNEYVSTPAYGFGANGITMEIVFKISTSTPVHGYARILDWGDTSMTLGFFNSNLFRCWVNAGGSRTEEFQVPSSTTGYYNNWNYAAMTYNKSVFKGYWNNTEIISQVKTGNLESGSQSFTIATGDAYYFLGDIAIVRVYNRGLTPAEIAQNFEAFRGRFGI
jgi:hypothetical protein